MILANVKHSMPRARKGEITVIEACQGPWKGVTEAALENYAHGSHLVGIEGRIVAACFDIKGWTTLPVDESAPKGGGWNRPQVLFWLKPTRWAYLASMVNSRAPLEWRWPPGMGRPLRYLDDEEINLPSA